MKRRTFIGQVLPLVAAGQNSRGRRNVLFISVDDLRPTLGCYGAPVVRTPNIDALARTGMVFERAYCQQAVCTPSRSSLLTGRRPDTIRVYDQPTYFRKNRPDIVTLPQYFKRNGYRAEAFGKVLAGQFDDPPSWSTEVWPVPIAGMEYVDAAALEKMRRANGGRLPQGAAIPTHTWKKRESWQVVDAPDEAYQDGQVAARAVEALGRLGDTPFFLAVGFLKPHLPFTAPRRYFDLYAKEDIRLAANRSAPLGVPKIALHDWVELRGYSDIPREGPLSEDKMRELVHAYCAATSYADAQIGKVLDALNRSGRANDTVVVLWGDHGWHLGEHGLWGKTTNFELDTRAPLIVRAPGIEPGRTRGLVEFVDIYPTLCDLCGLTVPDELEGVSMLRLMKNPKRAWKKAAFSQFPRGEAMGRTVRSDRYRYTEWAVAGQPPSAIELYDHDKDPGEDRNVADRPEYRAARDQMAKLLRRGWRTAAPD